MASKPATKMALRSSCPDRISPALGRQFGHQPGRASRRGPAQGQARTGLETTYTVELWFWNGIPSELRPITGFLVSRGVEGSNHARGDQLGIGGTQAAADSLFFSTGNTTSKTPTGKTRIAPRTWHHLALVRGGTRVTVYLDGNAEPEMTGDLAVEALDEPTNWFIGGRSDGTASFEGKISDVTFFARPLPAAEIASHFRAAQASSAGEPGRPR